MSEKKRDSQITLEIRKEIMKAIHWEYKGDKVSFVDPYFEKWEKEKNEKERFV